MLKACGLVVRSLWTAVDNISAYTHMVLTATTAWVQSYAFVDRLYQICTQLLPKQNAFSTPVIFGFYPLSTQPIKTTTDLKKGY